MILGRFIPWRFHRHRRSPKRSRGGTPTSETPLARVAPIPWGSEAGKNSKETCGSTRCPKERPIVGRPSKPALRAVVLAKCLPPRGFVFVSLLKDAQFYAYWPITANNPLEKPLIRAGDMIPDRRSMKGIHQGSTPAGSGSDRTTLCMRLTSILIGP